jgi:hypothetical protein
MTMGVKSEKTFEEIVERIAALFKLRTRPGDRGYEESIEIDSPPRSSKTPISYTSRTLKTPK